MTNARLVNWGKRYNLNLAQVKLLQTLIRMRADFATKWQNAEPHFSLIGPASQTENARLWHQEVQNVQAELTIIAERLGFTVDYGVGLVPVLERNGEDCIMVPE